MPARPIVKKYGRAKRVVFPRILDSVRSRRYPHHKPLVQDAHNLPKTMSWGSREHRLYLWFLCIYMKGGINSEAAIVNLSRFYTHFPEIFHPENLLGLDPCEIEWVIEWLGWILPQYGLGVNISEAKLHWVRNALKLARYWQSDPVNLFKEIDEIADKTWDSYAFAKRNYSRICRRIIRKSSHSHSELMETPNGFYGFQHKMVSMIAYFLIHCGSIRPFAYPVPVDFHILRVLIATGILRMKGIKGKRVWQYRERFLPLAREVTLRYVVEMKEDPQLLADGLWLLSRTLCRWHPGNKSSVEKSNRARRRVIKDMPFSWTPKNERLYDKSCGICPVEGQCSWNIPSAYYYVKGIILIRERRSKPDNKNRIQLHLLETSPVAPAI